MKLLLDFLPILLFFGAFKLHGIYVATAVLMAATVVQMGIVYATEKKLQTMQKATLVLILAFGTLTLVLQDDRFIKWKPTVLYGAMSLAMAVALWGFRKNFLHMMLGSQLTLPPQVWTRLSVAWVLYCAFMAALNAYVALYFSTEAWVDFKLWGYVFPVAFLVAQGLYIAPHLKTDEPLDMTDDTLLPTRAELEAALHAALSPSQLEVIDESSHHAGHAGARAEGFGTHFRVRIASPKFAGCSRVARHRLVYDALQSFVPRGLHAIAIETL